MGKANLAGEIVNRRWTKVQLIGGRGDKHQRPPVLILRTTGTCIGKRDFVQVIASKVTLSQSKSLQAGSHH